MQPDELSREAQRSSPRMAGEEEKAKFTLEEAFRHIKEAAGVTDIQEIVDRFLSQKKTHHHLEKVKGENEKLLQQLKEQKALLNQQIQDMKYSAEAKPSCDQQMLKYCEQQLQAQQQSDEASKKRLDLLLKALSTVRSGVKNLADKLQHITLSEDTVSDVSPDSDTFVVELMNQCELKLQLLQETLKGKDLAAVMKAMGDECVKLPEDQRQDTFSDDEKSEEDEADVISREALKRQSQLIIDSNSKKKSLMKKDKF